MLLLLHFVTVSFKLTSTASSDGTLLNCLNKTVVNEVCTGNEKGGVGYAFFNEITLHKTL